jgi:hypothetical protein
MLEMLKSSALPVPTSLQSWVRCTLCIEPKEGAVHCKAPSDTVEYEGRQVKAVFKV